MMSDHENGQALATQTAPGNGLGVALAHLQAAARDAAAVIPAGAWYRVDPESMALEFRRDTPYDAWESDTLDLVKVGRGIQWLVGDALAFGEDHWPERLGELFDPEQYAYETVERLARTSKAIRPDRRRPTVSHGVHQAVEGLPEHEQEAVLDWAEAHRATREEVRDQVRAARQRIARVAARELPVPAITHPDIVLGVADARSLPLSGPCIDLTVTSPPYGVDVDYAQGDTAPSAWLSLIDAVMFELMRVTKPHGRLALNLPLDTARGGMRATYAQAVISAIEAGWTYHSTIVWHDGTTTKGNRALGSINSAARPYHVSQVEMIALFSKGEWGPSSDGLDDISAEEWQTAGRGPWTFPGESHAWEGFPAAFPVELPRRLIRYLSRVGDTVLDPFLGSGSTAIAAVDLGRRFHGYDLDAGAVASTTRRLAVAGSREVR